MDEGFMSAALHEPGNCGTSGAHSVLETPRRKTAPRARRRRRPRSWLVELWRRHVHAAAPVLPTGLWDETRAALRTLRRHPGHSTAVVVVLGAGIGISAATCC